MRIFTIVVLLAIVSCSKEQPAQPSAPPHPDPSSPADDSTSAGSSGSGFPPPRFVLHISPGDVLTDVGMTPITVTVGHGLNVPESFMHQVAAATRLRTYPELEPVAFSVSPIARTTHGRDVDLDDTSPKEITIEPTTPLASRWYVVSVDKLPDDTYPVGEARSSLPGLGEAFSRFYLGSDPVLRVLTLAANGRLILKFSEGILTSAEQLGSSIRFTTNDGSACTLMPEMEFSRPVVQIGFRCPASAWSGKRIHLEFSPGLKSASGKLVGYLRTSATSSSSLVAHDPLVQDVDFSTTPEASGSRAKIVEVR